jgi:hypothetical protein
MLFNKSMIRGDLYMNKTESNTNKKTNELEYIVYKRK